MKTITLDLLAWSGALNSTIQLVKMAYDTGDVAAALLGTISLYDLADRDVLEQAPEELRAPLLAWWATIPADNDTPSLADTEPALQQLHTDWDAIYHQWRIRQRPETT